jgi:Mrp family chromosome partitioning ATPase
MNDRGLIDVPENAIRDEPIAFGLTGIQLGICGGAVLVAAIVNLLPIWEVIRVILVLLLAGPVFLAAALPVRGEPAYRWLVRAVRYRRGRRVWAASLTVTDKSQLSDVRDNAKPPSEVQELRPRRSWQGSENTKTAASPVSPAEPAEPGPATVEPMSMRHEPVRLAVVKPDIDDADASFAAGQGEAAERPPVVPHVLPGLRVACFLSFVGGTGRTTLAVEAASLVAQRARYQTMDGDERPVRVLVVDANRLASAVGLRLGLSPVALSSAWLPRFWLEPSAVGELAVRSGAGPAVLTLPPHHQLSVSELHPMTEPPPEFTPLAARAIIRGAEDSGYQLLVADLAASLEEGHRELIDKADVVIGVIRPTAESVAEPFRLAEVVRHMDAGRKLVLVASMALEEDPVRRWAAEAGLPFAARVGRHAAFDDAAQRGEPASGPHPSGARVCWPRSAEVADDRYLAAGHGSAVRGDPWQGPPDARRATDAGGPQPVRPDTGARRRRPADHRRNPGGSGARPRGQSARHRRDRSRRLRPRSAPAVGRRRISVRHPRQRARRDLRRAGGAA